MLTCLKFWISNVIANVRQALIDGSGIPQHVTVGAVQCRLYRLRMLEISKFDQDIALLNKQQKVLVIMYFNGHKRRLAMSLVQKKCSHPLWLFLHSPQTPYSPPPPSIIIIIHNATHPECNSCHSTNFRRVWYADHLLLLIVRFVIFSKNQNNVPWLSELSMINCRHWAGWLLIFLMLLRLTKSISVVKSLPKIYSNQS